MSVEPTWPLVAVLGGVIVVLLVLLVRARGRSRRRLRRRLRQAMDGERLARRLLQSHGYAVEATQETAVWWFEVDGDDVEVEIRADLIVTKDGRRLVAEVKTGSLAPDPAFPPTRRQLLEYALAYDLDVLLVDVHSGTIREVAFPRAAPS